MKLVSARLSYRRPIAEDKHALHALDNDVEVMRWINGGISVSLDRFEQTLFPVFLEDNQDTTGFWIIESESHGPDRFVGWVSLRSTEIVHEASLGYRLRRSAWGKGYATEAVRCLLDSAFQNSSLTRIIATTFEKNTGSQRVLEKSGFALVRRFRLEAPQSDTSIQSGDVWEGDDLLFEIFRPLPVRTTTTS